MSELKDFIAQMAQIANKQQAQINDLINTIKGMPGIQQPVNDSNVSSCNYTKKSKRKNSLSESKNSSCNSTKKCKRKNTLSESKNKNILQTTLISKMKKIVKLAKTKIITGKNMCKTCQSSTHVNLKVPATDNFNVNSCNSTKQEQTLELFE